MRGNCAFWSKRIAQKIGEQDSPIFVGGLARIEFQKLSYSSGIWVGKEFFWGIFLNQYAFFQKHYLIRNLSSEIHLMGDDDHGIALFRELLHNR